MLRWFVLLSLLLTPLFPVQAVASDIEDFSRFSTTRMRPEECSEFDTGTWQYSCKHIEIGAINGWIPDTKLKNDARWQKIRKYWNDPDNRLKFAGVACARSDKKDKARRLALGRAKDIVTQLVAEFEEDYLTGNLSQAAYEKKDSGSKCVEVPNSSGPAEADATKRKKPSATYNASAPDDSPEALRRVAERKAEEQRKRTVTFIMTNNDRYTLSLQFHSIKRKGYGWPGGNKHYVFKGGTATYKLQCSPGEKVCFGAWRDYQTMYWGVGKTWRNACDNCCTTCGNTFETTLTDGGPDSYPSKSSGGSGGSALQSVIDGVNAGLMIGNIIRGSGAGYGGSSGYTSKKAPSRRSSGISGTK
ncbi:MAG: hypothetical protein LCH46_04200 [Proteobacteria bacterium]|nr:hypothetical protein [Pseudomonadota bacterium]